MKYKGSDKMISLISNDYRFINVISRFGIPMGFGDMSISEICKVNKVDGNTFLSIVNFMGGEFDSENELANVSVANLIQYLKNSHAYFIDFFLPSIRRKLLNSIRLKDYDVSFLIIKMFDEYVDEVKLHMEEEEKNLFTGVISLIEDKNVDLDFISSYSKHHESVSQKLKEVKNIIIKYCPSDTHFNLLNAALYDIFRCEEELNDHCRIEDYLLMPSINKLKSEKN